LNPYRVKLVNNIFFHYYLKLNTYYSVKRPVLTILFFAVSVVLLTTFNFFYLVIINLCVLFFLKIFLFYCLSKVDFEGDILEKRFVKFKELYARRPSDKNKYWCAVSSFFFAPRPDYDFSVRLLREILKEDVTNLEAFSALAEIYYSLYKREKADLTFAAIEALCGDAWSFYKRGIFLFEKDEWRRAFICFKKAGEHLSGNRLKNKYLSKQVLKSLRETLRVAIPYYISLCLEYLNKFEEAREYKEVAYREAKWLELKNYVGKSH